MKGTIVIYALPNELLDLKDLLDRLRKSVQLVHDSNIGDSSNWNLHVILGVSQEIVNWFESKKDISKWVTKTFVEYKEDWDDMPGNHKFEIREDILGCSDARRVGIDENKDTDYFIWLDPDIVFDPVILYYMSVGIGMIEQNYDTPYFVLTPEIVRIWDHTWDCLVNDKFLDKPINYQKTNNPYVDTVFEGDASVEELQNNVPGLPRFKFAGGWFNCYSARLLNYIGIPKTLGPYGVEDTWLMHAMEKLVSQEREDMKQFKLKNVIVCENYLYRDETKVNGIVLIDRRQEFRKEAHRQANLALQDL
jgi:hypothetical protein